MPYILLLILLVRGLMLPGALDGLHYYLVPQFEIKGLMFFSKDVNPILEVKNF